MSKHVPMLVGLFAIWLILAGGFSGPVLGFGALFSLLAVVLFRNVTGSRAWLGRPDLLRKDPAESRPGFLALRRLPVLLAFLPVFLWKVLVSGANMAFLALKPTVDFWPGIVRVHGGLRSLSGTTVFASLITLTPGTLTLDYDEKSDDLYVHWIDVSGYGEADLDSRITSGLRVWMRRLEA